MILGILEEKRKREWMERECERMEREREERQKREREEREREEREHEERQKREREEREHERLQEQERRVAKRLMRRLRKLLARLKDVITRDVLLTKSSHSLLLAMLLFALFLELLGWFILTGLFITFLVYLLLIIHPAFVVKNTKPEVILKRTATLELNSQLSASSNYPLPCKEKGQEIMTSPFWQKKHKKHPRDEKTHMPGSICGAVCKFCSTSSPSRISDVFYFGCS